MRKAPKGENGVRWTAKMTIALSKKLSVQMGIFKQFPLAQS